MAEFLMTLATMAVVLFLTTPLGYLPITALGAGTLAGLATIGAIGLTAVSPWGLVALVPAVRARAAA